MPVLLLCYVTLATMIGSELGRSFGLVYFNQRYFADRRMTAVGQAYAVRVFRFTYQNCVEIYVVDRDILRFI